MLVFAPIVPCRNHILDAIRAAVRGPVGNGAVREVAPLLGVGAAVGFLARLFSVGGGVVVGSPRLILDVCSMARVLIGAGCELTANVDSSRGDVSRPFHHA